MMILSGALDANVLRVSWWCPGKVHPGHKAGNPVVISSGESIAHDGSMVLLYMVCHGSHQYTPVMLGYIPAPWIRHG
jgi:hypothetical protein